MEYEVFGDLLVDCPNPYSIYLRGPLPGERKAVEFGDELLYINISGSRQLLSVLALLIKRPLTVDIGVPLVVPLVVGLVWSLF